MTVAQLAWQAFSFGYGLANLVFMVGIATFRDGAFTKRPSESEKKALSSAQKRYWSLTGQPLHGFMHKFFTLRNGTKLHYVLKPGAPNADASTVKNVAICIHGFPDSFLLWRKLLTAGYLDEHILIAVDLPGYGGSDNLPKYGANEILETMTEFILGMREQYLHEEAKLVVVSHDWGGVIATRLASEASQLADRFVIASAVIPQNWTSNASTKTASAKQMLHTYFRRPLSIGLLRNALSTLKPVFSQVGRSFYVFIFNLPYPLSTFFVTFGDYWLLKVLHNVAAGLLKLDGQWIRKLNEEEATDLLVSSTGPGIAQLEEGKLRYPEGVNKRIDDYGMSEKIRIYREGFLLGKWEKSLETVVALSEIPASASRQGSASSGAGLFDEGPSGALKAPATVIYGKFDAAFDKRLALEGISDYLSKASQVVLLEAGHWVPVEEEGSVALEKIVEWALGDEGKPLRGVVEEIPNAKMVVEK
ncbi:alpha/beta-hydrolase [Lentithecium fluviatile CBS 122367]|uniref:Alpha/beta-hydrolase n=1 Tax=Lentithecium fluviatile CBS 122367 TaxID=1168545 RepID=A0A6G1IR04_9PLEO|nr:alpha/beta-hydrolase [Lentithecium fluviatile CBS 122367]